MRVRICEEGPFAAFVGKKCSAVTRHPGEVVDYPEWYARGLVAGGLAEECAPPGSSFEALDERVVPDQALDAIDPAPKQHRGRPRYK